MFFIGNNYKSYNISNLEVHLFSTLAYILISLEAVQPSSKWPIASFQVYIRDLEIILGSLYRNAKSLPHKDLPWRQRLLSPYFQFRCQVHLSSIPLS